jgi:glycosyltransferase involved in cell wall biosynthesis
MLQKMKTRGPLLSIITVCYNSISTIEDTIKSVISQDFNQFEYIIIDGGSTDGTLNIINKYLDSIDCFISERDDGLWDAMNKGVSLSSGAYLQFLNSDDCYTSDNTLSSIFSRASVNTMDLIFGKIVIVDSKDRVKRKFFFNTPSKFSFRLGLMPPHPATFYKKYLFDHYGGYSLKVDIAPDFDILLRFFQRKPDLKLLSVDLTVVRMKDGGLSNSSFSYRFSRINRIFNSCVNNKLYTCRLLILFKYPFKVIEWLRLEK